MVSTKGETQAIHLNNYEALVHIERTPTSNLYEHCKRKMSSQSSEANLTLYTGRQHKGKTIIKSQDKDAEHQGSNFQNY